MKDGNPRFILDTDNADYQKFVSLLKKNDYDIYDAKDVNDVTFYYNCYAYFDPDGEYETKDGRLFHFEYNLSVINSPNFQINREVYRHIYDGKDGINFTVPVNVYLEEMIKVSMDSLRLLYPEEKPVGVVEPEYIYAIYSCRIDDNGDKKMTLPYYTKDIKAAQELISLENIFYESFSNGKEKTEWYEISEIDVESNKHIAEFIKSTTKEITLEDVKNIKPTVTAYITTTELDEFDKKWNSLKFNKTLYVVLYPDQPKIEGIKLDNNVEHIDSTGFLHISHSFIVDLEDVEHSKQTIYASMINKAIRLLKKQYKKYAYSSLEKILEQFDNF
jgi:hypothetical protein